MIRYKPEYILKMDSYKVPCDFYVPTDELIRTRKRDLMTINKKELALLVEHS